jgi:3-hydroxy acid dehydrogenase/malonic semialdehyde reductase
MSTPSQRLAGKTILITGASSGIGRSTALEFARTSPSNLKLILTARRIDRLQELAAEITKEAPGVKVHPVQLDVSNADEVRGFVAALPEQFREVDVLVNNAYVHHCYLLCHDLLWLEGLPANTRV